MSPPRLWLSRATSNRSYANCSYDVGVSAKVLPFPVVGNTEARKGAITFLGSTKPHLLGFDPVKDRGFSATIGKETLSSPPD